MKLKTYTFFKEKRIIKQSLDLSAGCNHVKLQLVGALTSKPASFKGRSWEFTKMDSVDFFDALGSDIRVEVRGTDIIRILPKVNSFFNLDWISDKIRFAFDGLKYQRLEVPLLKKDEVLTPCSWREAFSFVSNFVEQQNPTAEGFIGKFVDLQGILVLKDLLNKIGAVKYSHALHNTYVNVDTRENYILPTTLLTPNVSQQEEVLFFIGYNPRLESPVLNLRFRQKSLTNSKLSVLTFGINYDLTYKQISLGSKLSTLINLFSFKHKFSKKLAVTKNLYVFAGTTLLLEKTMSFFLQKLQNTLQLYFRHAKFCVISTVMSQLGALELNFNFIKDDFKSAKKKLLYLVGTDNVMIEAKKYDLVVYQGHHGHRVTELADVVFPAAAPLEKESFYLNLFGHFKKAKFITVAPGVAKEDWKIFFALSSYLKFIDTKPSVTNGFLTKFLDYFSTQVLTGSTFLINAAVSQQNVALAQSKNFNLMRNYNLSHCLSNFYLADGISRVSPTMALAYKRFSVKNFN